MVWYDIGLRGELCLPRRTEQGPVMECGLAFCQSPEVCTVDQGIQEGETSLSLTTRQAFCRAWATLDVLALHVHTAGCGAMSYLLWHDPVVCVVSCLCVREVGIAKVLSPCAVVCGVCWDHSHVVCDVEAR